MPPFLVAAFLVAVFLVVVAAAELHWKATAKVFCRWANRWLLCSVFPVEVPVAARTVMSHQAYFVGLVGLACRLVDQEGDSRS